MGWFQRKNPTKDWIADPSVPLRLDLEKQHFNGVSPGDSAAGLSFLGSGKPGLLKNEFDFHQSGITLGIEGEILRSFHLLYQPNVDELARKMKPFPGTLFLNRKPCSPGAQVGVANLIADLGKPDVFEDTRDEKILTYLNATIEWELILTPENRIRAISAFLR